MRLTTAGALPPLDLKGKGATRCSESLARAEAAEEWLPGSQRDPDPVRNMMPVQWGGGGQERNT